MAATERPCVNCGTVYKSRFVKQLYCHQCQILRDLNFGMGSRKCDTCAATFWPIRNSYRTCPSCMQSTPRATTQKVECNFCSTPGRAVPGTDKACLTCVSSTQEFRNNYRAVLRLHVRKTKEANNVL